MSKPDIRLEPATRRWLEDTGFIVQNEAMWAEALTHGSTGENFDYQRLEFLGDRVLGLTIADWLFERNRGAEGQLAQRLNALVSKTACAIAARAIDAGPHIRMGKQATSDGAGVSENVLGDIMESLLGANHLQAGFNETRDLIHHLWSDQFEGKAGCSKHPKSALQEWAAAKNRAAPEYETISRSGPDHKSSFTVRVSVHNVGEAEATSSTKQAAEKLAAENFMREFG